MSEREQEMAEAPRRARQPRADVVAGARRRRNPGSLNRMAQFSLDCIEAEDLDLENYTYRWINDTRGRLHQATVMDDYDFVRPDELGPSFGNARLNVESDERIRMLVDTDRSGNPIYAYYCKKPRAFWEADNEEIVRKREDMMSGRVYHAQLEDTDPEGNDHGVEHAYVPAGVKIGSAAQRKRGPIPRNFK